MNHVQVRSIIETARTHAFFVHTEKVSVGYSASSSAMAAIRAALLTVGFNRLSGRHSGNEETSPSLETFSSTRSAVPVRVLKGLRAGVFRGGRSIGLVVKNNRAHNLGKSAGSLAWCPNQTTT